MIRLRKRWSGVSILSSLSRLLEQAMPAKEKADFRFSFNPFFSKSAPRTVFCHPRDARAERAAVSILSSLSRLLELVCSDLEKSRFRLCFNPFFSKSAPRTFLVEVPGYFFFQGFNPFFSKSAPRTKN